MILRLGQRCLWGTAAHDFSKLALKGYEWLGGRPTTKWNRTFVRFLFGGSFPGRLQDTSRILKKDKVPPAGLVVIPPSDRLHTTAFACVTVFDTHCFDFQYLVMYFYVWCIYIYIFMLTFPTTGHGKRVTYHVSQYNSDLQIRCRHHSGFWPHTT